MKRVKQRARAAYILAALLIAGLGFYVFRYITDGGDWARSRINQDAYSGGILKYGTITDRNGVRLASSSGGKYSYADDLNVRMSSLHVVGDYVGNIGTGAIGAFTAELLGYSPVMGMYRGPGETAPPVALTIDSELQRMALEALWGRRGAVLLMDYTNGEILCMVSSPTFDPVSPPDLSAPQYEGAYLNRTISSSFVPGSVFKIATLAAAIEEIDDIHTRKFTCTGSTIIDGRTVTCTGWHGEQTIELAFANSCNPAFAELSVELGADVLERYVRLLGLIGGHEIDGIPTAEGSFTKGAAGSAELAWSGIGQSEDMTVPYSLLRAVAAVANGGEAVSGHLLLNNSGTGGAERLMSSATARAVSDMMAYNVAYSYGEWSFPGLKLCAKTGTAEVGGNSPHAWFAGFLTDEAHPYAFVVLVENGGGGLSAAGPVANAVLQAAVK